MTDLSTRLSSLLHRSAVVQGVVLTHQNQQAQLQKDAQKHRVDEEILSLVAELFRQLVDKELTAAVQMTETLLSEGLQSVFHDLDLSVRAITDVQRGKVSVEFHVVDKLPCGRVAEGPAEEGFGGAVTTVLSVILRILLISRKGLQGILMLDESLPAIENRYVVGLVAFLDTLAKKLGIDMLIITHNPVLVAAAPRVYRIKPTQNGAVFQVDHNA